MKILLEPSTYLDHKHVFSPKTLLVFLFGFLYATHILPKMNPRISPLLKVIGNVTPAKSSFLYLQLLLVRLPVNDWPTLTQLTSAGQQCFLTLVLNGVLGESPALATSFIKSSKAFYYRFLYHCRAVLCIVCINPKPTFWTLKLSLFWAEIGYFEKKKYLGRWLNW